MPSSTHIRAYLLLLTSFFFLAVALVVLDQAFGWKWLKVAVEMGQHLGRLMLAATVTTFILVEWGGIMLAAWLRKAEIQEAEQRVYNAWQAWRRETELWEQRRDAAREQGQAFGEPRPTLPPDPSTR